MSDKTDFEVSPVKFLGQLLAFLSSLAVLLFLIVLIQLNAIEITQQHKLESRLLH